MTLSARCIFSALFLSLSVTAASAEPPAAAGALKSAWTQYGPGGVLEARAVVEGGICPQLALDLTPQPMQLRAKSDSNFLTVCAAVIPPGTKQAAVAVPLAGHFDITPLALPAPEPQRIVVLGDTGCRIKGAKLQACSDPVAWPFPGLAAAAARLKPDLVIHVGDYLYREQACPATFAGCQGTPFGDNWPTWDADFFAPAQPLLAAAPWVIVRGNHEDCNRAGPGFMRLLGPAAYDPAAACAGHLAPYAIPMRGLNLVVGDNADAPEKDVADKLVPVYRAEFEALAKEPSPTWWLQHRPIWGLVTGPLGIPAGGNLTLVTAAGDAGIPAPVSLMLSGHIHTFEAINYSPLPHVPPQLVAGFGGDYLDPTPADLHGAIFQGHSGVSVKDGLSIGGFGFLLMSKTAPDAWAVDVYDWQGHVERRCSFAKGRVDCPVEPAKRKR